MGARRVTNWTVSSLQDVANLTQDITAVFDRKQLDQPPYTPDLEPQRLPLVYIYIFIYFICIHLFR